MVGWPPSKGELEELYLNERLSADDTAARFGRTGKYPGAIVYHYLRKYGIPIRDRTAHQRHMSEGETAACIAQYGEGKSLWDLADEYHFSAETIRKALISHGVETRDKVEAQIQKVTKHKKHPFSGDPHEKAYLYGLRQGDLWVTRHGRAVRVKTSTTHPAMMELVASCFLPYGAVHIMPRRCKMTGYEWSIDCDLDSSFSFLQDEFEAVPDWVDSSIFSDYLAGFFDAEGSVMIGGPSGRPRLCFTNSNTSLLREIGMRMPADCDKWRTRMATPAGKGGKAIAKKNVWKLESWDTDTCINFLSKVPIRHPEKKAKARLLIADVKCVLGEPIADGFGKLRQAIKEDVRQYVELASLIVERRAADPGPDLS